MQQLTVVITGAPAWLGEIREHLQAAGFAVKVYADKARYVARLADNGAALVLVDGDDSAWQFWTVTPKTSPATRRIPVIVIGGDAEQAKLAGADGVYPREVVGAELAARLREMARTMSDQARAELLEQCDDPLPPEAVEAIERFNNGEYYRQHDLFEALWMDDPRPVRDLYRAILQVGIAYYQIERGNWRGAHKMLLRSVQWLALLPDVCQSVDIAALREDSARVRAELERVGEDGMAAFDKGLLKAVKRVG